MKSNIAKIMDQVLDEGGEDNLRVAASFLAESYAIWREETEKALFGKNISYKEAVPILREFSDFRFYRYLLAMMTTGRVYEWEPSLLDIV